MLERLVRINVVGAFIAAREAVRRMSTQRGGRGGSIVNVSSGASQLGSPNVWVHYAATKGAIGPDTGSSDHRDPRERREPPLRDLDIDVLEVVHPGPVPAGSGRGLAVGGSARACGGSSVSCRGGRSGCFVGNGHATGCCGRGPVVAAHSTAGSSPGWHIAMLVSEPAQGRCWMRTRLPAGSRKAQSRMP